MISTKRNSPPIDVDYIKGRLPSFLWRPIRAVGTAILGPLYFSMKTGHFKSSLRGVSCDAQGDAIPWYTYPAVDLLLRRSYSGKRVLEFGAGQSTIWWANRSEFVLSIEPDEAWSEYLKPMLPDNAQVFYVPVDYVTRSIQPVRDMIENATKESFDIIIIDGHLRGELVDVAFEKLAPDGVIIFDNSEGYDFFQELQKHECSRVDFYGFSASNSKRSCTSFVFKDSSFIFDKDHEIVRLG